MWLRLFYNTDTHELKKLHSGAWLSLFAVAIIVPFAFALLHNYKYFREQQFLLDSALLVVGIYGVLAPLLVIFKLFSSVVGIRNLTSEKLLQLLLTYFYMLFAFAGIFFVLYFHSEIQFGDKALSGVNIRLLTGDKQVDWVKIPETYLDMLYFSTATLTTLGFGDIVAKTPIVKFFVIIEALLGNLLLVLGFASIVPRKDS